MRTGTCFCSASGHGELKHIPKSSRSQDFLASACIYRQIRTPQTGAHTFETATCDLESCSSSSRSARRTHTCLMPVSGSCFAPASGSVNNQTTPSETRFGGGSSFRLRIASKPEGRQLGLQDQFTLQRWNDSNQQTSAATTRCMRSYRQRQSTSFASMADRQDLQTWVEANSDSGSRKPHTPRRQSLESRQDAEAALASTANGV